MERSRAFVELTNFKRRSRMGVGGDLSSPVSAEAELKTPNPKPLDPKQRKH